MLRRHLDNDRQGSLMLLLRPKLLTKANQNLLEQSQIADLYGEMYEDFRFVEDFHAAVDVLEALRQQRAAAARLTHDGDDSMPCAVLSGEDFLGFFVDDFAKLVERQREELFREKTRRLMGEGSLR